MAAINSIVTGALVTTTTRAVVAVPSTTSISSSSVVSSSKASSSTTSSIVSSTTSSSIASSTTSSVASTTSSSRASSSSSSSRAATSSLRASSTLASSSSAAPSASTSAAAADSTGLSSLAKSLIIAGIVVASAIALIVAVGFLLRRRRDGRRDRRDRTHELDGYGKDGDVSSPHIEKDQPGVGDERFVQALGRGERPSGRAGSSGMGGIYGASSGAGAMYAGSEASLQQQPMAVNDGGWGSAGGYDASGYPPQQAYSPGGFAPPHSASQQYLVQRSPSPSFANNNNQQQPYSPSYANPQDEYFRSPSPYGQLPPPPPPSQQQQQSYYSSNQQQQPYDAQPQHDPYQDPSPLEAQAMAGVGGDPSLGGALVPGGALDEEGVEMRVVRGFKATLEDELAIVPFTLLRVHQSYEDGWSLCSNPGTKERGVVPRDCLALPSSLPSNALPPSPSSQPRNLPQIPSQSFSSSNLYDPSSSTDRSSQYAINSKHQEALDENDHPLAPPPTFGFAVGYEDNKGRPLSVVVRDEDGTEREVMRSELGPGGGVAGASGSSSGEFGGLHVSGIPRSRTATSLTPSERTERRSSLMDSVRAAGAYLDQGGASGTHL